VDSKWADEMMRNRRRSMYITRPGLAGYTIVLELDEVAHQAV
jgi:hypothetical protein